MCLQAVIGSHYGDEGKGLITDYLASRHKNTLVIRYNGGAQAGHTVVTPQNKRHIFHQLGSGSFTGAATYLSQFFIFDPNHFMDEYAQGKTLFKIPPVYVDPRCCIATPYDLLLNQYAEYARGSAKHGSCGLGIGETVARNEDIDYQLKANDLLNQQRCYQILERIRCTWCTQRLKELKIDLSIKNEITKNFQYCMQSDGITRWFLKKIQQVLPLITLTTEDSLIKDYPYWIFEGAQGLLLDQNHGHLPHVTRSNTGLKNIISLLKNNPLLQQQTLTVNYVTRAYLTRHGAGPLNHELAKPPYQKIIDKTNVTNPYQDHLRFAYLDLDQLSNIIQQDLSLIEKNSITIAPQLAITCLDQLNDEVFFYVNHQLQSVKKEYFVATIAELLKLNPQLISYGATRNTISINNSL